MQAQHLGVGKKKRIIERSRSNPLAPSLSSRGFRRDSCGFFFLLVPQNYNRPNGEWPVTKEPIANRSFELLDELEDVLDRVRSITITKTVRSPHRSPHLSRNQVRDCEPYL